MLFRSERELLAVLRRTDAPLTARDLLDAVGSRGDELVRVRVDASLDGSDAVNERLAELESGEVDPKSAGGRGGSPSDPSTPF